MGQFHLTFFTDAPSFPHKVKVKVDQRTGTGMPTNPPANDEVERQLLVDVVMSLEAAKAFQQVLASNLNLATSDPQNSNA